jgi:hypothetical protein
MEQINEFWYFHWIPSCSNCTHIIAMVFKTGSESSCLLIIVSKVQNSPTCEYSTFGISKGMASSSFALLRTVQLEHR